MKLRSELKEAMAAAEEGANAPNTARCIRTEEWVPGTDCVTREALSTAQAALSVCDEYEEVEVRPWKVGLSCVLLLPEDRWFEKGPSFIGEPFTILRRKQKPDVTEPARRAVKAWRRYVSIPSGGGEPISDLITALAEAVDE